MKITIKQNRWGNWWGYIGGKRAKEIGASDFDAQCWLEETVAAAQAHGGARPHAGRKPSGRKPFLVRVSPDTIDRLKKAAEQQNFKTVGEMLEAMFPAL